MKLPFFGRRKKSDIINQDNYSKKNDLEYQDKNLSGKDINSTIKLLLTDDNYFNEFMSYTTNLNFSGLDYELLVQFLKKIDGSNFMHKLYWLDTIDETEQFKLLNESFSDDMLVAVVKSTGKNVQSFFYLEDKRFHDLWKKFNVISLVTQGYKLADEVIHKEEFFNIFKSTSIVETRMKVNQFMSRQPNMFFLEKFINYEKDLISNYDIESGLFKQYQYLLDNISFLDDKQFLNKGIDYFYTTSMNYKMRYFIRYDNNDNIIIYDKNGMITYLQELSKQKLTEIMIDLLFQDNIFNVWINIKEMLRFNKGLRNDEKVLDNEQVNFYETILNIDYLDKKNLIELFNKLKDKNMARVFYEDLQKVKNKCYDKIKSELFQPENMKGKEDKKLSSKYKVPVFDLRDKEYVILARCLNSFHIDQHINRRDCYTLLTNDNSYVMDIYSFIYGYSGFDNDCVLHMFEGDSFSIDVKQDDLLAGSDRVNRIMTSRELATNSHTYSEVQIVNKKSNNSNILFETLKPSFLIVYDKIDKYVLGEAKRKNLPICILSKTKDQTLSGQIPFDRRFDKYISDSFVNNEEERRKHR